MGGMRGIGRSSGGPAGNAGGGPLQGSYVAALEESEEDDLLRFTAELDFEAFVASLDDAELQESVQAMGGADGKGPAPGEEKAWRRNLVQAMNHAAMRKVVAAGRTAAAAAGGGGDDAASVAGMSEGAHSRCGACEA
ncbi:hypothetical protein TSOC_000727 [Tetrabaena socialis]|uniref:Uncharacterized protein n=1 Tax=Tetrabaena socialis TaxID=47790 RepID=A0A2J8AIJ6_9CHLO|nr:hypothetical protein TSOC_000727 [Tetrabaena socialis]|eukprot:PNH12335.1 hypothetical protein TSOC_000727 [Tetrabaena socialis]